MIGFLTMALAVSAVGTLGSCKDYDDDNRVELQGEYAKLRTELAELSEQLGKCCEQFKKDTNNRLDAIDGKDGALENLNKAILALKASTDVDHASIETLLNNYAAVQAAIATLTTDLSGKLDASDFYSEKAAIESLISTLESNVNSDILELRGELESLKTTDLEELKRKVDELAGKEYPGITEERVNELIAENQSLVEAAIADAVEAIQGNTNATLADIQESLAATDLKYSKEIEDLKNEVEKEIGALKAQLGSLVTSVLVQGTYNPVFGSLTAPFNVQSNVLAAYYGKAEVEGSFPFANPGMLVNSDNALSAKDKAMIGAAKNAFDFSEGQTLIDKAEGNAGTIYLTINPTAVNFEGLKFRLENSLGDESPVKLGELSPSSKRLTFGWTRGAAANGFYEAQATVAEEDIQNAKLVVDMTKSDVQEIFKDITSPRDGIDIMNIANKVYSVVNDVCDANAVKAYWGEGTTANSTLSQYSIAATAVKPLSFAFMKDYHIDSFYGVDRIKNFINKTIDGFKLSLDIPEFDSNITITPIEFDGIKSEVGEDGKKHYYLTVSIEDNVKIKGTTVKVNLGEFINGKADVVIKDEHGGTSNGELDLSQIFGDKVIDVVIKDQDQEIEITGEVDITNLIEPIEGFNENIEDLNEFLGQVNDMIEEINGINQKIEDAKNDIASQINKYIDALNKRLCNVVNSIHDRLQPLAIAHNGKEFYTLSGVKNMPSKVSGNTLNIVPTTYTAELVVPVFKKHVAVTNVFKGSASAQGGDAACLNALKAANNKGDMNTVVAGTTRNVEFVGEKGFVYEIAYSALDYSGKAVTKKYYVTVE